MMDTNNKLTFSIFVKNIVVVLGALISVTLLFQTSANAININDPGLPSYEKNHQSPTIPGDYTRSGTQIVRSPEGNQSVSLNYHNAGSTESPRNYYEGQFGWCVYSSPGNSLPWNMRNNGVVTATSKFYISDADDIGQSVIVPTTLPAGSDSLSYRYNVIGHHCALNMSAIDESKTCDGFAPNIDRLILPMDNRRLCSEENPERIVAQRWNNLTISSQVYKNGNPVSGSGTSARWSGSSSCVPSGSNRIVLNFDKTYSYATGADALYYVLDDNNKPCHRNFSLTGLNNLRSSPGRYTFEVTLTATPVTRNARNQYSCPTGATGGAINYATGAGCTPLVSKINLSVYVPHEPQGNLEAATCENIIGWVYDEDYLQRQPNLHMYFYRADGTEIVGLNMHPWQGDGEPPRPGPGENHHYTTVWRSDFGRNGLPNQPPNRGFNVPRYIFEDYMNSSVARVDLYMIDIRSNNTNGEPFLMKSMPVDQGPCRQSWQLTQEAAYFQGGVKETCMKASPGQDLILNFSVQNIGSGDVTNNVGPLADVYIGSPRSEGTTNLTYVGGVGPDPYPGFSGAYIIRNIEIAGNSTYSYSPFYKYRIPANAQVGDKFYVDVAFLQGTSNSGNANPTDSEASFWGWTGETVRSPGPRKTFACAEIADYAYLKVHGSGVWNGGEWLSFEECLTSNSAITLTDKKNIQSQIKDEIGSSAEYGVTSVASKIEGFASGVPEQKYISSETGKINILSFANKGATEEVPGNLGSSGRCLPRFYEYLDKQAEAERLTWQINTIISNLSSVPNDSKPRILKLAANSGFPNLNSDIKGKVVVISDGDITINHDIRYDTSNYGSYGNLTLPSLVVVARGNINIGPNVRQLDGLFIATPNEDGTDGGNITTCNTFSGTTSANRLCGNYKLEVNGAFVTSDVDFHRFAGGRLQADQNRTLGLPDFFASETFKLSPELYIANPLAGLMSVRDLQNQKYDYYIERAPVY